MKLICLFLRCVHCFELDWFFICLGAEKKTGVLGWGVDGILCVWVLELSVF